MLAFFIVRKQIQIYILTKVKLCLSMLKPLSLLPIFFLFILNT